MRKKTFFYDLALPQLKKSIDDWGQPKYRAGQIWEGFYKNLYSSPSEFTNVPKSLIARLDEELDFSHLQEITSIRSSDNNTQKTLFKIPDGSLIETVLMSYDKRRTVCISTQSGCAMGCVFCATGQMGYKKNLSRGEIVEQVLGFSRSLREAGERVTHIVIMGMGEPFHNYDETMGAIKLLTHPDGFNLGARRITISTVGLIPEIERFANEKSQVNLAISLHATEDDLRTSMLPINKKYPIKDLMNACRNYVKLTGRRITFEWALIQGTNDSEDQAIRLAKLLRGLQCHVNIIPLNPTEGYKGQKSSRDRVGKFKDTLVSNGISCTIRVRRGIDIDAGCGQLASNN